MCFSYMIKLDSEGFEREVGTVIHALGVLLSLTEDTLPPDPHA